MKIAQHKARRGPSSPAPQKRVMCEFLALQTWPARDNDRDPEPRQGNGTDLRTHLLRTVETEVKRELLSFKDILRAHLGISINLQIYPKFSKFAMTNVTVPLN